MPWSISQPSFSAWRSSASADNLGARRHEAGHQLGRVVNQALDAHELAPSVGQPVVERAGMAAQEGEAGVARGLFEASAASWAAASRLGLAGRRESWPGARQ